MVNYRALAIIVPLIFFVLYIIYQIVIGAYFLALAILFILFAAIVVYLTGIEEAKESWLVRVFCLLAAVLTIAQVLYSSPASNLKESGANSDLFLQILFNTDFCPYENQPDGAKRALFKDLAQQAASKCLLQNNHDMSNLAFDLGKAVYLPPAVGLADSLHNDFLKNVPVRCIELARQLDALCPDILNFEQLVSVNSRKSVEKIEL